MAGPTQQQQEKQMLTHSINILRLFVFSLSEFYCVSLARFFLFVVVVVRLCGNWQQRRHSFSDITEHMWKRLRWHFSHASCAWGVGRGAFRFMTFARHNDIYMAIICGTWWLLNICFTNEKSSLNHCFVSLCSCFSFRSTELYYSH